MKYIAALILILISLISFGQTIPTDPKQKIVEADTFWYEFIKNDCINLKLKPLTQSSDSFNLRFWTDENVVEISISNNGLSHGYVISYTTAERGHKIKKWKTLFQKTPLDSIQTAQILNIYNTISSIPDCKKIQNWKEGLDGTTFFLEISSPGNYQLKSYWCPNIQDSSLTEAKQIQNFIDSIEVIAHKKKLYHDFFSKLKPGSYGNGMCITTILNKKQIKLYKKGIKNAEYFLSINDSIFTNISNTFLKNGNINQNRNFDGVYYLKFSNKNCLKKILTLDKSRSISDLIRIHKNKRVIQNILQKINMNSILASEDYWLSFTFNHSYLSSMLKIEYVTPSFQLHSPKLN